MSVLLIAGSPSHTSRSAALLESVGKRLAKHQIEVTQLQIRDLDAQALIHADFAHPSVLPLATGGSPHHMLALDYALRPVLQALAAKQILPGIYATDAQVFVLPEGASTLGTDLAVRVDEAVHVLVSEVLRPRAHADASFAPVHFSQVRCSV